MKSFFVMNQQLLNPVSDMMTPDKSPEFWYAIYNIIKEDAPEIMDEFIENTASRMELTVDYFVGEFL
jgi:hypothetical protein